MHGRQESSPLSTDAGGSKAGAAHVAVAAEFTPNGGKQKDVSHQRFLGFVFNALSTVFLMVMGVCAKLAGQHGLPVMQIVLARSATLLVVALATIYVCRQDPRGNRRLLLVGRGLCGFTGITLWYSALLLLPLADVVVFSFLTPLIVALLSSLLVNEQPSCMVIGMTPVCLAGVVLCLQPPFLFGGEQRLNSLGVTVALGQAFVASLVKLSVRELRTSDSSNVIIFYLGAISTTGATAACIFIPGQWVLPRTPAQIGLLAGTGLSAYAFQVTMTMGLRRVKAAPAAAIAYLSVVWGLAASIGIFHESPNLLSLAGGIVICLGTLAVALSEAWQRSLRSEGGKQESYKHEAQQDEESQPLNIEMSDAAAKTELRKEQLS